MLETSLSLTARTRLDTMTQTRQLHLGAFMRPVSLHTGAWRYPGAFPDANFNFAHLARFAQTLERGRFHAFFMADHLAVLNMPVNALKRSHTVTSFEPFTLLSALAGATEHIGLIATGSPTVQATPPGALFRAVSPALGARRRHRTYRPDRDWLDHVRRALSRRPPLCLARSHLRRARGLGYRHDLAP